ncbi:PilW family protein [Crenothrix sp.]|uniref:PilW family protein n=1 Tax=Crenothrix sp. TaxID=3100433 RepID=UPI00374CC3A6
MIGFCFRTYRSNKGFTMVELMVAMAIGVFFLNGILQIFSSSRQIYRVQENLARLQENGRFAIDFISQDVRMAGYWGCSPKVPSMARLSNPGFFHKLEPTVEGFEAMPSKTWLPDLPSVFPKSGFDQVLEGSDILVIRKLDAQGFSVINHGSAAANLQLAATSDQLEEAGITKGSLVIATDCTSAEAFQVTNTGNPLEHVIAAPPETVTEATTPRNKYDHLTKAYQNAKVHAVKVISYYVATNANNEKLLYRRANGAVSSDDLQLVDGVEQMQVLYGVDTADADLSPNYYVNADDVNKNKNWDKVIAVRISLLLATLDDNVTAHPLPYFFDGEKKTPEDRKIRRVFTSTIALRNPLK